MTKISQFCLLRLFQPERLNNLYIIYSFISGANSMQGQSYSFSQIPHERKIIAQFNLRSFYSGNLIITQYDVRKQYEQFKHQRQQILKKLELKKCKKIISYLELLQSYSFSQKPDIQHISLTQKCQLKFQITENGTSIRLETIALKQASNKLYEFIDLFINAAKETRNKQPFRQQFFNIYVRQLKQKMKKVDQICVAFNIVAKQFVNCYEMFRKQQRKIEEIKLKEGINKRKPRHWHIFTSQFIRYFKIFQSIKTFMQGTNQGHIKDQIQNLLTQSLLIHQTEDTQVQKYHTVKSNLLLFALRYNCEEKNDKKKRMEEIIENTEYLNEVLQSFQVLKNSRPVCFFIRNHMQQILNDIWLLYTKMISQDSMLQQIRKVYQHWKYVNQLSPKKMPQNSAIHDNFKIVLERTWIQDINHIIKELIQSTYLFKKDQEDNRIISETGNNMFSFFKTLRLLESFYCNFSEIEVEDINYIGEYFQKMLTALLKEVIQLQLPSANFLNYVLKKRALSLVWIYAELSKIAKAHNLHIVLQLQVKIKLKIISKLQNFAQVIINMIPNYDRQACKAIKETIKASQLSRYVEQRMEKLQDQEQMLAFIEVVKDQAKKVNEKV